MMHEKKIWPEYFEAVADGRKTFEIRKFDTPYGVGDMVKLREWDPEKYAALCFGVGLPLCDEENDTNADHANRERIRRECYTGRSVTMRISYFVKPGTAGLPNDLCVFGVTSNLGIDHEKESAIVPKQTPTEGLNA